MQHQVHRADAQHGHARIVVEAAQGLGALERFLLVFFQMVADQVVRPALLVVGQDFRRGVRFEDVLVGVDQKAAGAGGQVADALVGAWGRSSAPSCG